MTLYPDLNRTKTYEMQFTDVWSHDQHPPSQPACAQERRFPIQVGDGALAWEGKMLDQVPSGLCLDISNDIPPSTNFRPKHASKKQN